MKVAFKPTSLTIFIVAVLFALGISARAQFTWDGSGTFATAVGSNTLANSATLAITTSSNHDFNGTALINNGTVTWNAGDLRSGNGGTITNNATWNDASSGFRFGSDYGGTVLTFTNSASGTYNKSIAGTTTFQVPLINHGAVNVSAGTLSLAGGGSLSGTGTFTAASGATVNFNSDYAIATGASLLGSGVYQLLAGTLTINGTINVSNFNLGAGTLAGTQTFTGAVVWTGANLNSSGTTTIASGSTLAISGTNNHDFNGRALVNNGTVTWNAGDLRSGNGGTITNNATWNDASSGFRFGSDYGGTVLTFTNSATGTYNKTVAGTTTFQVPLINQGAVTVSAGTLSLAGGGSLSGSGTFTAASGTLVNFNSNYAIANGASLLGLGSYQLLAGTLTINGTINVSNFNLGAGTLAGTQTFTGAVVWTGANLNSSGTTTIASGSTLAISGTNNHDFNGRALVNNGTVTWNAGDLRSGNGGTITNNATWNDASSGFRFGSDYGGTVLTFTNSATGTYNKTVAGTTTFQVPLINQGAVTVSAGTLSLAGGGSLSGSGTFTAASGTLVNFNSNYAIASGASLLGSGAHQLLAGTLTVSGTVNVNNFTLAAGTLAGTPTFTGNAAWTYTDLGTAGTTTVGATGAFSINGTGDHNFSGRALVNNGTVTWNAGHLRSGNGGTITNNAAWNDASSGYEFNNAYSGTVLTFTNSSTGTYTKSVAGTTTFHVPLVNQGALTISAGTLNLAGGGSFGATGTVTAAAGALIKFNSNFTIADASLLAGTGSYELLAGALDLSGVLGVNGFTLQSGTLTNSQTFNNTVNWTYTDLSTAGTTTVGTTGTFSIYGTGDHDFSGRALVNNGTVTWSAGHLRSGNGGSITNNAVWNDASSGYYFGNDFGGTTLTFTNSSTGTYTKSVAGTTTFHVPFTNSGSIVVQAGTLAFNNSFTNFGGSINTAGGNVSFANALNLGTGTLGGSGTITAPSVTAGGIVAPGNSPGALTVTGDLSLLSTATTRFEIGGVVAGTQFDTLTVSGTASLNGTLELKFVNSFASSILPTDTFVIINAASLTGTFSNLTASGLRLNTTDGLGSFQVDYSGLAVSLSNFAPVPEPSTYALLALGLGTLLVTSRRRRNS